MSNGSNTFFDKLCVSSRHTFQFSMYRCWLSAYRIYTNYRRQRQHRTDFMRRDELRRKRRKEAREADAVGSLSGTPQCVVCLTNAVEVLLLECGHLCLCTDCCEQITDNICPICRCRVVRQVAAYLP